jgi:cytolysin-activating lysine-acyltransferase
MRCGGLEIIAPAALAGEFGEAEAFGSAVWLWMNSTAHHDAPLHLLSTLLLPAIKCRQFVLASENGKPVFYLAWARFSEQAEKRYLTNPPQCMPPEDWQSGDRQWVLDWIAPFGHTRQMRSLVLRRLFPDWCARALYHRGDEKGLRVIRFHGIAVTPQEARFWFDQHPCEHDRSRLR